MSSKADFIDLTHGEEYMPRFAMRDCYFKLLFRYEEENVHVATVSCKQISR